MDFNLKDYQIFKLKKYFRASELFFLSHSAKSNLERWVPIEQNLKKLKLNCHKTLNSTTTNVFKNSIFHNCSDAISSFVVFINPKFKSTKIEMVALSKGLKPTFSIVALKLNNKIYSSAQLKDFKYLSYRKNVFNLYKSLDNHLKGSYRLTNKKKISK